MANEPQYTARPSLQEVIETFRAAMFDAGIEYHGEIVPSLPGSPPQRFRPESAKHGEPGWYKLYYDDRPAGVFGDFRTTDEKGIQWQMDGNFAPLTPEEKAAFKAACAERDAIREKERLEREEKKSVIATNIWDAASEDVPADHDYLKAKQVKAYGLRCGPWSVWVHPTENEEKGHWEKLTDTALLIKLVDVFNPNKVWSIQAIVPPSAVPAGKTNKLFLPGGAKIGRYFMIGKPQIINGRAVFILCEGYATGASIHEATGHAVIVTFDSGNLVNVAKALRDKTKKSGKNPRFLIAGDNDQFTIINGVPSNAGNRKANEAAGILGCDFILPDFADLEGNPTDFNDLHCREGLEVVAAQFDAYFNPKVEPEPDMWDDSDESAAPQADSETKAEAEPFWSQEARKEEQERELYRKTHIAKNQYFRTLGYRGDSYYFYINAKRIVSSIPIHRFSEAMMCSLAPLSYWEQTYPVSGKAGFDKAMAVSNIFETAAAIGPYDESMVRAPGAWRDGKNLIYHFGTEALVNGQVTPLRFIQGKYVYQIAPQLVQMMTPLTVDQAGGIRALAQRLRWERPHFANLLAGWYFLAPICGVLPWRPHLWVTGPAGSGKSTILKFFADWLLDGAGLFFLGNSSEAGIRQSLKSSALPVVVDEFESNDKRERQKNEAIMAMARQASSDSGAKTARGSANGDEQSYLVPSMFCMGSINVAIDKRADSDRFTILDLLAGDGEESTKDDWEKTDAIMREYQDDESFPDRWVSRSVMLMPEILKAVAVFRRVGVKAFVNQRNTDQLGTLMAGDYMLDHDEAPTPEQALDYLNQFDWTDNQPNKDDEDATQAINYVLDSQIRSGGGIMFQIKTLLVDVYAREHGRLSSFNIPAGLLPNESRDLLANLGIKYDMQTKRVGFTSTPMPEMKKLISDTSFATNLRGQLSRIKGAEKSVQLRVGADNRQYRCTTIPISACINLEGEQDDLPL